MSVWGEFSELPACKWDGDVFAEMVNRLLLVLRQQSCSWKRRRRKLERRLSKQEAVHYWQYPDNKVMCRWVRRLKCIAQPLFTLHRLEETQHICSERLLACCWPAGSLYLNTSAQRQDDSVGLNKLFSLFYQQKSEACEVCPEGGAIEFILWGAGTFHGMFLNDLDVLLWWEQSCCCNLHNISLLAC